MAKKKTPALKGPLTIENARQQQALFHQRSRRAYREQPAPALGDTDMKRIVFGIYLEIADFAGSLMYKNDRDKFAEKFNVLYASLQDYRQHLGSMFEDADREPILRFINDTAAGAYDMVDAFLNIPGSYRAQLLYLVNQFVAGKVVLEHHKVVPNELLEPTPDQEQRHRIYCQYYELGYRIVIHDTIADTATYPSQVWVNYQDGQPEKHLSEIASEAREFLAKSNLLAKLPSAGIVYRYFPRQ